MRRLLAVALILALAAPVAAGKRTILDGATDQTIDLFIQDSSSTTGAGLSGLVYNSAGLVCYYREGATGSATQLTLATQTVGGAHSDGGFVEIQSTNMKGIYRLDLSDTIVDGSVWATVYCYGATNMVPVVAEIELVSYNPFDSVRLGLTALPNAAAEASGGLYTRGSGAGQIAQDANGQINVNVEFINDDAASASGTVTFPNATLASTTNITAGTMTTCSALTTNNDKTGYALSAAGVTAVRAYFSGTADSGSTTTLVDDALTQADADWWRGAALLMTSGTLAGQHRIITAFDAGTDTITVESAFTAAVATQTYEILVPGRALLAATTHTGATVPTVSTLTGHTAQTGDSYARLGAPAGASVSADVAAVKSDTAAILVDTAAMDTADEMQTLVWDSTTVRALTELDEDNTTMDLNATTVGTVTTATTCTNLTNAPTAGDLTATMKTSVNAEVVDALATDTYAEPGQGAPAATASIEDKISWLYAAWRNLKTQTATQFKLYADDGTTVITKATCADDGTTTTVQEQVTGP